MELDPGFEQFVSRSSPALLRSAYLLTGDRGHAEDLLQGTLLRVAARWDRARAAPEPYARRVLVNLSRDRRRGLGRRPAEVPLAEPAAAHDLDPVAGVVERQSMSRAVAALPTRQREVVVLRFYLELSVFETAATLRCSEGTVKSYTARALARLRELLTDPPAPPAPSRSEAHDADR